MADLVFRSTTRGGRDYYEVTDDGMTYGGKDRYNITTSNSRNFADTVDEVLADLVFEGAWRINYDKIEVDELGIGEEYKEIVKLIRQKYNWLYNLPKGSKGRQFYFDIGRYFRQEIARGTNYNKIFDKVDDVIAKNKFEESKESIKESEELMFGNDLIKLLEKKYGMNRVKEYPTKYKDGHTETNFVYAFVEDMDDLTSSDPFIVFSVDDETDAVIWGELNYINLGNNLSMPLNSFRDVENFFKKIKLNEKKESIKEARLTVDTVWSSLLDDEDYEFVNGVLSLADFEQDDAFFIPNSSWRTFPKKNPPYNQRNWNCKAQFLDEDGNWKPCTIVCTLPWEENLDAMGKTWNDITSYMLLVQAVFIDRF